MKRHYLFAAVLTFTLTSISYVYANGTAEVPGVKKQKHDSMSSERSSEKNTSGDSKMYGYTPAPLSECGAERWVVLTVPENYFRSGDVLLPAVARPGDDFPPL